MFVQLTLPSFLHQTWACLDLAKICSCLVNINKRACKPHLQQERARKMQSRCFLVLVCFGLCVQSSIGDLHAPARLRRQATTSDLPSLTTTPNNPSDSASQIQSAAAATSSASSAAASSSVSSPSSSIHTSSSSPSHSSGTNSSSSATHVSKTSTAASSTSTASNSTATAEPNNNPTLPIQPHITPALSIAGVVLILTGTTYALIGIKNRWISIFLSTAYLVGISVLVLIDYVMHPPVSDAVQGAYFVAVFLTGCIFGGGALIFKEITESLGCLLGGFCLGMWFLTLKSGGVVEGSTGVGILLAVFCIVGWLPFFSKYTRDYALIGSTSFSGSTALTLGIDCFSRSGYKEFWLYIWNLNSDLFPLNTNTYPLTRGMRVEIAVIVIGTIVGVISQMKLWKVIRERRKQKEAIQLEEESRRDAVDEALGRHLQRQDAVAKQQWEKIYGDSVQRPISMVYSVIDSEGQSNRGSRVSVIRTKMHSGFGPQSEVVEVRPANARHSSQNLNRQSTMSVNAIPEQNEEHERSPHKRLTGSTSARSISGDLEAQAVSHGHSEGTVPHSEPSLTFDGPTYPNTTNDTSSVGTAEEPARKTNQRRSIQSFFKRLSGYSANPGSGPSSPALLNMSQEALMMHQVAPLSRASSVAATLDEDHDKPDASRLSVFFSESSMPPAIVVSPAGEAKDEGKRTSFFDVPPSPPAISAEFDPEELARPVAHGASLKVQNSQSSLRSASQNQSKKPEGLASPSEQISMENPTTSLTTSALEAVPSQLSNVVLSYRTNEWAKHSTTADAPVDEGSSSISDDDKDELPTRVELNTVHNAKDLNQPEAEKSDEKTDSSHILDKTLSATSKPPKPHILPDDEDVVKNRNSRDSADLSSLPTTELRHNQSAVDMSGATSRTKPVISTERGLRSSSTPVLCQSLVSSPIEENVEMSFRDSRPVTATPSHAGAAILSAQRQNLHESMKRSQSQQDLTSRQSVVRSISQQGQRIQRTTIRSPTRPSTATENTDILYTGSGSVTPVQSLGQIASPPTRLTTYDSHQPIRQSTAPTQQQRVAMLADWRTSIRQDLGPVENPEQTMAERRADMLAQRAMLKRSESQQSFMQASREGAMNQLMRRGDMQDAHRAALRKMQAKANEKA